MDVFFGEVCLKNSLQNLCPSQELQITIQRFQPNSSKNNLWHLYVFLGTLLWSKFWQILHISMSHQFNTSTTIGFHRFHRFLLDRFGQDMVGFRVMICHIPRQIKCLNQDLLDTHSSRSKVLALAQLQVERGNGGSRRVIKYKATQR